jgi:hypothetical protein
MSVETQTQELSDEQARALLNKIIAHIAEVTIETWIIIHGTIDGLREDMIRGGGFTEHEADTLINTWLWSDET